jgi:hypothetical protein
VAVSLNVVRERDGRLRLLNRATASTLSVLEASAVISDNSAYVDVLFDKTAAGTVEVKYRQGTDAFTLLAEATITLGTTVYVGPYARGRGDESEEPPSIHIPSIVKQ